MWRLFENSTEELGSIPQWIIDLLGIYGEEVPAPGGGTLFYFNRTAKKLILSDIGPTLYNRFEHFFDACKVVYDGTVVTVGWLHMKLKK